jgi:aryl-alcohol dehydrogenase-like predicted oxidoreductase
MRRVVLENTDLQVSRLSFGTASLHHLMSSGARQNLLEVAIDNGFTHFDSAPLYGYGLAESELGRFAKQHRGKITIATKVGLYPPPGARATAPSVWMRRGMGKLIPNFDKPRTDWSIELARRSLDASLRRLAIDHVDLLFLHDPTFGSLDSERFSQWLEHESRSGRVGGFGLAGPADQMGVMVSDAALARVLQVRDSVERHEADIVLASGRPLQFTYGYFADRRGSARRDIRSTLSDALVRNYSGSVVVSSRDRTRVRDLANIANQCERRQCVSSQAP